MWRQSRHPQWLRHFLAFALGNFPAFPKVPGRKIVGIRGRFSVTISTLWCRLTARIDRQDGRSHYRDNYMLRNHIVRVVRNHRTVRTIRRLSAPEAQGLAACINASAGPEFQATPHPISRAIRRPKSRSFSA